MTEENKNSVVIIGAGPAGLTAAYELCKADIESIVLEKDDIVGGISRTVNYKDYYFDIGGHRFFTKVRVVDEMWRQVLKEDFLRRNRQSRIYYKKKYFYYPLRTFNALLGLGILKSLLILLSYFRAQIFPEKPEQTFEQWVSNRFGKRLYQTFFKAYTEKVWGRPCSEISAKWAAQRIKGLSLLTAVKNAVLGQNSHKKVGAIKTLIDNFDYPKKGPGMMWEAVADIVQKKGSQVRFGSNAKKIHWNNHKVESVEIKVDGRREVFKGTHFISSMPLRELIQIFEPRVPDQVMQAAMNLKYRDFITVALIINKAHVSLDNWIYIHDPQVKVGRIQNFKNWSPHMVPDPNKTCLGLEYFCFEGDELWTMTDRELIALGRKELEVLGLAQASEIFDGAVVRMPKAYPVYESNGDGSLLILRQFFRRINNLQVVGRNGMHKYNNQDHSMLTAMMAVENILGANHDLWQVNTDQEYSEEISTKQLVEDQVSLTTIKRAFARMDKFAFAAALGSVCGLGIFFATIWLIIVGGEVIGPNLQLLNQYFIGYTVSFKGAFIGMGYSMLWGFLFGWLFAYLRNLGLSLFLYRVKRKAELLSLRDFFDHF